MTVTESEATSTGLSLLDELVLTLLNEESGYFRQVPGWNLNCAVIGGALAELSLMYRIDTDMESLILLDKTKTGDPTLDPILAEIAAEPEQHNAQYWIERLAPTADSIVDKTLAHLVDMKILQHHEGDFWSLAQGAWMAGIQASSGVGTAVEFVKTRISKAIFTNEIPSPRDVIIISLVNTCDVLRYIFELDEVSEQRIEQILKMDLIGRAIAEAVSENIAGSIFRQTALSKAIPKVKLRRLLRSKNVRVGNMPAILAELHEEYGPVFELNPPFQERMTFLVGSEVNHWVHRHGRMHLRARDYLEDFEKVYGGVGLLPALDGADHFRFRKSVQPGYARARLEAQLEMVFDKAREDMATWNVGESRCAVQMCRRLVNSELSPLTVSIDSQDVADDMHKLKERALKTHLAKVYPKFMLKTPSMRRRLKLIDVIVDRILRVHTPAQRAGCPRDLADEFLSMHASDRQFLPESNLRFLLTAPLIASMYVGDQLSFAVYMMLTQPDLHEKIIEEADALFADGNPDKDRITGPEVDVTRRFIMECLRMYPIVPLSVRTVMNACSVEGFDLPEGTHVFIGQTGTHYMSEHFPDPFKFDIDRYDDTRKEHVGTQYAPYGLGTHTCLGTRWTESQIAINLLMMVHHFDLKIANKNYKLKISPFPSMSPSKKLKINVVGVRHPLPS